MVVPTNLKKGVFTTCDFDNVDQKKQSSLSKDEFHGTLISATNHISHNNQGEARDPIDITGVDMKKSPKLPDSYSVVEPAELSPNKYIIMNKPLGEVIPYPTRRFGELVKEQAWVKHLREVLNQKSPDELETTDIISWAGFHAQNIGEAEVSPKAIIGLLPPFEEKAGSVAMCKHSMIKMVEITVL